jgi:acetyl esterase/lipase
MKPIYRGGDRPSPQMAEVLAHFEVLMRGMVPTYFQPEGLAQNPPQFRLREPLDTPLARLLARGLPVRPELPEGVTQCRPVRLDGGLRGEWILAEGADPGRRLLYLHGGGYAMGDVDSYRFFIARLSRESGCAALAVDYRLAPEHPYPAALEDARSGYRALLAGMPGHAPAPSKTYLVGDSAGGGLALALALDLRDGGGRSPNAIAAMSPGVDLTQSGATLSPAEVIGGGKQFSLYYAPVGPLHPGVSPLHAELAGLPPVFLQAGETEGYLDDSVRFAAKASAAGVPVTFEIWRHMPHVHQLMAPLLPEANEAVESLAAFLRRN